MATSDEYAQWIVNNADKKGTPEFDIVTKAYQDSRTNQKTIQQQNQDMSWPEAVSSGFKRFAPSAVEVAKQTVEPLLHPIDTATGLKDIAIGAVSENASPEQSAKWEAVKDYYKNRYGTEKGFKEAIANDPAGVMTDVASIASGGLGIARGVTGKALTIPRASGALGKLQTLGEAVVNPVGGAIDATKTIVNAGVPSSIIGATTGVGKDVISELYSSGKTGGEKMAVALRNMRSSSPSEFKDLITDAREALTKLKKDRATAYESGMAGINADNTILDFPKVQSEIQSVMASHNRHGRPSSIESADVQTKINSLMDEYSNLPADQWHTASGLDWLKREIGEIAEKTDQGTGPRKIADEAYSSVRKQIAEQAPEYSKVMKDYENASELLHELQGTFSLGEKSRNDTAIRKLQQALRNNVNTNFGYRGELINELENAGATNMRPRIAGQAASSWTPRGLQGAMTGAVPLATVMTQNPSLLAAMPFQSPRLMGEGAVLAGQISRKAGEAGEKVGEYLPNVSIDSKTLAKYLYQMNQPKGEQ